MEKTSHRNRLLGDILQIADHVLSFPVNQHLLVASLEATTKKQTLCRPLTYPKLDIPSSYHGVRTD